MDVVAQSSSSGAPLLDLIESRRRRDEALAQVRKHGAGWIGMTLGLMPRAREHFRTMEVTGEQIRHWLLQNGASPPHHANAWGALVNAAIKAGYLLKTNEYVPMADPRSHGRVTRLYRWAHTGGTP